jgi:hypothetical protein
MTPVERRYSKEEIARRGDAIYEGEVRVRLKDSDQGKFVAIDIETSDYEVADDELVACQRLRARVPEAQTWLVRTGFPYVYRFGRCTAGGRA